MKHVFPRMCPISFRNPLLWPRCTLRIEHCELVKSHLQNLYVLLGSLIFKDSCYLFSNLYYSLFVPATLFLTCHSKLRIVNSPTRYDYILKFWIIFKVTLHSNKCTEVVQNFRKFIIYIFLLTHLSYY